MSEQKKGVVFKDGKYVEHAGPIYACVDYVECSNCPWISPFGNGGLPIENLLECVQPGDNMPFCRCPSCGSLAYRDDSGEANYNAAFVVPRRVGSDAAFEAIVLLDDEEEEDGKLLISIATDRHAYKQKRLLAIEFRDDGEVEVGVASWAKLREGAGEPKTKPKPVEATVVRDETPSWQALLGKAAMEFIRTNLPILEYAERTPPIDVKPPDTVAVSTKLLKEILLDATQGSNDCFDVDAERFEQLRQTVFAATGQRYDDDYDGWQDGDE